jgi:ABC-type uncharacterized transport system permease subunit
MIGLVLALGSLRLEALRRSGWQLLSVGLGVLSHTVGIGFYCAHNPTHYFTSWSENFLILSWALGAGYLLVLATWQMRALGIGLLPLVGMLLFVSQFSPNQGPGITGDAESHPLFAVHVMIAFLGYGLYLTGCAASLVYLQQGRLLKRKLFSSVFRALPSLDELEKTETLCIWTGLILFTVALVTGAILVPRAIQPGARSLLLEPKILATAATWMVYLVLAVGRASGRLAGRSTAKVVLVGAVLVILTFLLSHPYREPQPSAAPLADSFVVGRVARGEGAQR